MLNTWSPRILSVLRIVTSLLFMEHGFMKLFHFPAPQPGLTGALPPILTVAAWLELVGGALLVVGLYSRQSAFILSGQMAVAYFMVHARMGFYPALNMGELAILYSFIFMYISFAGGGAWSVDALRKKAGTVI